MNEEIALRWWTQNRQDYYDSPTTLSGVITRYLDTSLIIEPHMTRFSLTPYKQA